MEHIQRKYIVGQTYQCNFCELKDPSQPFFIALGISLVFFQDIIYELFN